MSDDVNVISNHWAIVDATNNVRVLLSDEKRARRLCDRFHHIGMDHGPFRVAHVYVVEA